MQQQQPNDKSWFLNDSSNERPIHDLGPPRVEPDFPQPVPHEFRHAPEQFPQPQHEPLPRAFPTFDNGDDQDGEHGADRGLRLPNFLHKPQPQQQQQQQPPPPYTRTNPSGFRLPLSSNSQFPPPNQSGPPPFVDADGVSPVFVGSAIFEDSVHPCKIAPSIRPPCRVPYGGTEREHNGRYDLLPITSDMEWVPTEGGKIPHGRRPVEGGYETHGVKLYHALADIDGVKVPGKTGEHLGGANIPFGGYEHIARDYKILCWR